jgi:hypothetical protein
MSEVRMINEMNIFVKHEIGVGQISDIKELSRINSLKCAVIPVHQWDFEDIDFNMPKLMSENNVIVFDELYRSLPSVKNQILKLISKRKIDDIPISNDVFLVAVI